MIRVCDNAARVARSGCGVHFDASSLSIGRVTKAMSRLLSDDQVARSCVKAQQLMVTGDAARQAAVAKVRSWPCARGRTANARAEELPHRDILRGLVAEGFSQAEIARELGVTRQAIQKMLAG
jgi:DNA-binding NarL/FixJ family response regulator